VADSRQAVIEGDLDAALEDARDAASLEPWAATPHLQQALVLEEKGEFTAAAHEAALAVEKEPFNWEHRWTLSRIEEAGGNKDQATFNFYAARELNRLAPYFTRDQDASALTPLE
jgi:hypothetical protein